jgi:lysophospholipase L1-like esterase
VITRAFDGFQTGDVLNIMDRAVLPFRPRVVVYYCGSNDVDTGEPTERIAGRIQQFVERVHAALPSTRIVFVSVNRSPQQQDVWTSIDAINHQVEAYAASHPYVQYVDVNRALADADGTPRLELFQPDERHLRPAGYEAYTRVLKPILTTAFASVP